MWRSVVIIAPFAAVNATSKWSLPNYSRGYSFFLKKYEWTAEISKVGKKSLTWSGFKPEYATYLTKVTSSIYHTENPCLKYPR